MVVHAIGDSVLFVAGPDGSIRMCPEISEENFRASPTLLCSHDGMGAFADTTEAFDSGRYEFEPPHAGWSGSRLLAASDAVAAWVAAPGGAAQQSARLDLLFSLPDSIAFRLVMAHEIGQRRMARDDCTIMIVLP
jgi:hypothetical protein